MTTPGAFISVLEEAVRQQTGRQPVHSTGGGTSDARFIRAYCPVVEFGSVGTTMHMVDECVPVDELYRLEALYRTVLDLYFKR